MAEPEHFPRNVPFKPSPAFIPWFIIGFLFIIGLILVFIIIPLLFTGSVDLFTGLVILFLLAIVTVLFVIWTKLYYESMFYELHADELRWRRGVWFRTTGIVPYNRITNLDLKQGPLMRWLKIFTISIQTAGYSGQAVPEIRIEAIEHAEELRELLRSAVRICSGTGDGTGTGLQVTPSGGTVSGAATDLLILNELKKIRQLLEEQKRP